MDAKIKAMALSGMMGLCLILGILAALGGSWITSDEWLEIEFNDSVNLETTYALNSMTLTLDTGEREECQYLILGFEEIFEGIDGECDGSEYIGTWGHSDSCEWAGEGEPEVPISGSIEDLQDDLCATETAGTMGTIGMWGGIICALLAVLIVTLPMAGVEYLDNIPDIAKMIVSWAAGGLMLVGIILWVLILPGGDTSAGASLWMAVCASVLGLGAAAIDQFIEVDQQ